MFTNECVIICEWITKYAKQSKRDKKKQLLGFFKILHEIILNLDNLFSEL